MKPRVIVACEFSARVRDALRRRGVNAYSCDLLPCEGDPRWHLQGDVRDVLRSSRWVGMIAHPECTRLCNSGVRWLEERNLWADMRTAAEFFRFLWEQKIPKVAMENPVPHRFALEIIGRKYDQIIQPYEHGHGETKKTCLWLRGLPRLRVSKLVPGREPRVHKEPPGPERKKNRSRTYPGIADAMGDQWSYFLYGDA